MRSTSRIALSPLGTGKFRNLPANIRLRSGGRKGSKGGGQWWIEPAEIIWEFRLIVPLAKPIAD